MHYVKSVINPSDLGIFPLTNLGISILETPPAKTSGSQLAHYIHFLANPSSRIKYSLELQVEQVAATLCTLYPPNLGAKPVFCTIFANFFAANLLSSTLFAPVTTMRLLLNMSAVVRGSRVRTTQATKRFGLYDVLRAYRAICRRSNKQFRFAVATKL